MMADPTIRVLSLGAGVQSTVLALMACDGTLPGLDAAVFADTGWEPPAVYEQVDRLAAELARVDIPLYRVSSGNLRADTLDPEARFVSVPWFTLAPKATEVPVYGV
ncbi:phosphoadenosine phosphosulfate reductase domain-containing protein, partial [Mycobacteroides abscessus]|uniref:phosphoadenosine phosphosulfate reductase domain-containing protein n=7 Tax=Mycobacteriaceae TaxID=1762 RepID=UPI00130003AA